MKEIIITLRIWIDEAGEVAGRLLDSDAVAAYVLLIGVIVIAALVGYALAVSS